MLISYRCRGWKDMTDAQRISYKITKIKEKMKRLKSEFRRLDDVAKDTIDAVQTFNRKT